MEGSLLEEDSYDREVGVADCIFFFIETIILLLLLFTVIAFYRACKITMSSQESFFQ